MRYIQHIGQYGLYVILSFFLLYPSDALAKEEPNKLEDQREVKLKIVNSDEGSGEGNENEGGTDDDGIVDDPDHNGGADIEEPPIEGTGDGELNETGSIDSPLDGLDGTLPNGNLGLKPIKSPTGGIDDLNAYEQADTAPLPQTGIEDDFPYTWIGLFILSILFIWQIKRRMEKRHE